MALNFTGALLSSARRRAVQTACLSLPPRRTSEMVCTLPAPGPTGGVGKSVVAGARPQRIVQRLMGHSNCDDRERARPGPAQPGAAPLLRQHTNERASLPLIPCPTGHRRTHRAHGAARRSPAAISCTVLTLAHRDLDLLQRYPESAFALHGIVTANGITSWRGFELRADRTRTRYPPPFESPPSP